MKTVFITSACTLCSLPVADRFAYAHDRWYLRCSKCQLIFMHPDYRLSEEAERQRYELHQNCSEDPAYRAHLSQAIDPLLRVLQSGAKGLDFGSGPGPTAALMFGELGFKVSNYDPYFAPDPEVLDHSYDFIVCTESAEHFFDPFKEFDLLHRLAKPGGWLSLMTQLYTPAANFDEWYYAKDPTHTSLYCADSIEWISKRWGWEIVSYGEKCATSKAPIIVLVNTVKRAVAFL